MKRSLYARSVGAMLLAAAASPLMGAAARAGIVDQVKGGVLAHDVGIFGSGVEGGADIVGEVLFTSPGFLNMIGAPRPTFGGSVNTAGHTDYVYFDMTWTATVWRPTLVEDERVYIGGFLGGAVHDGHLRDQEDDKKALGTRALYHLGVEVGYQIDPTYSVETYFSHLSNAGASSHNPGLNNIGVRIGFHF